MKKWKLIVSLFFILCMFVTISFVSAQDNATIDSDNSEYETQLGDNKSFNDLNNEINGDLNKTEIILNDNYLYQKEDNFTEGIIINRSLSIDGQGHVINANKLSRIFLINAKNVELKNIKFMNGNADLQTGGAIHFDYNADGRIINSMFLYNKAMNGGAIGEYENSMVTIINSTFIKNEAIYGGTIFCHNSSNAILDSVFINNSTDRGATGFGGVIYYSWYSNSSILNSTFINNYATKDGGCILFSFDCNGTIINSTFINNKAKKRRSNLLFMVL